MIQLDHRETELKCRTLCRNPHCWPTRKTRDCRSTKLFKHISLHFFFNFIPINSQTIRSFAHAMSLSQHNVGDKCFANPLDIFGELTRERKEARYGGRNYKRRREAFIYIFSHIHMYYIAWERARSAPLFARGWPFRFLSLSSEERRRDATARDIQKGTHSSSKISENQIYKTNTASPERRGLASPQKKPALSCLLLSTIYFLI